MSVKKSCTYVYNLVILSVSSFTPGKTNVLKCRHFRVRLVVCISAVRPRDLCGSDQLNAAAPFKCRTRKNATLV